MVKFLRRAWSRYAKLGKGRKKKQVWRKPTGRDNKMREKRKGYPATVSIGYRSNKKSRDKLLDKKPVNINNLKDLEKIKENEIAIIGRLGKKKKIEIANKAKEMNIKIYNMNPEKFLEKNIKKIPKIKSQSKEEKK
ncbi:MAG: eL32 family ribosomal protein [Nanoarchaeota archaeon]